MAGLKTADYIGKLAKDIVAEAVSYTHLDAENLDDRFFFIKPFPSKIHRPFC